MGIGINNLFNMELKFKHFVFLNALDAILTWYAFTQVHGLGELNPILSPIFNQVGLITGLITTKLLLLMVIYALIYKMPANVKFKGIGAKIVSTNIICIMFIVVVLNNSYQILIRVI